MSASERLRGGFERKVVVFRTFGGGCVCVFVCLCVCMFVYVYFTMSMAVCVFL